VLLVNGATASNVFWQVGSSATLGTGTSFAGSIVAEISITATTGASSNCGLYALTGAVTLDTNKVGACSGSVCQVIGQSQAVGPLNGCPSQRTFIRGAAGKETYNPNTKTCTRPTGKSCSIYIVNSTNKTQSVTLNGKVVFTIKSGANAYKQVSYNQAGTYVYSLLSNHNASLTVIVS